MPGIKFKFTNELEEASEIELTTFDGMFHVMFKGESEAHKYEFTPKEFEILTLACNSLTNTVADTSMDFDCYGEITEELDE